MLTSEEEALVRGVDDESVLAQAFCIQEVEQVTSVVVHALPDMSATVRWQDTPSLTWIVRR